MYRTIKSALWYYSMEKMVVKLLEQPHGSMSGYRPIIVNTESTYILPTQT
jgi:hypothetical protein